MISWLLALLASSQVPYELLALVYGVMTSPRFHLKKICNYNESVIELHILSVSGSKLSVCT